MPFLGSKNCHGTCSSRIQGYLEKDGRALARDFVLLPSEDMQHNWAYFMDRTRSAAGNDAPWGGRRAVTYYHFIVSPDPRDKVGLEALRDLTMAWVHEFFGSEEEPGELGSYEVAVVYHDDNANRIPHAHVIVNNTDFDSPRRLQIGNKANRRLTERLQELADERRLGFLGGGSDANQARRRYFTRTERSMRRDGRFVWKDDLANKVDIARHTASSVAEFEEELRALAVGFVEKDADYVFSHPSNPGRWKCSGHRLGADYTKGGISRSIDRANRERKLRDEAIRRNVTNYVMSSFFENMELAAVVDHATSVQSVASALRVCDELDIRSEDDCLRRIRSLRKSCSIVGEGTATGRGLARQAEAVAEALETIRRASFFKGVALPKNGSRQSPKRARPGSRAPSPSGSTRGSDGSPSRVASRAKDGARNTSPSARCGKPKRPGGRR